MSLTSLGNVKRPIREQIRDLAKQVPRFVEKMSSLTKKHRLCVAAATIPVRAEGTDTVYNECFFFGSAGDYVVQGKRHMTRFETGDWNVSARSKLRIFETGFGRVAIAICDDVEFPKWRAPRRNRALRARCCRGTTAAAPRHTWPRRRS